MDLYRENLLDHYKNPRNFGKPAWKGDFTSEELNPSCGDRIGVAIKVRPSFANPPAGEAGASEGEIEAISFWGEGCVVSVAAMSMLTERIKSIIRSTSSGQESIKGIKGITGEDVLEMLGGKETIPPARYPCAFLGLEAVKKALKNL